MSIQQTVPTADLISDASYSWVGRVLTHFAVGEQAIGNLCMALDLSVSNGSLTSLSELRLRLDNSDDRKCRALQKRIARWNANRPFRHLLAHATIFCLTDASGKEMIVTRHLPRDASDVTPDRVWTAEERSELQRQAANDGRSIHDHVKALLADPVRLARLRKPI